MAFADGVFVFRWNKAADIKEPAQKAIIVYDHGREDLLLQVKYEGRLQNFGWLIPVPSLPEVQRGWMAPFYELSRLTQNPFAGMTAGTPRIGGVRSEQVNVVEIKTVGVYEVAILSAHDALSLERWLGSNGYSGPEGRSQVLDDYVNKGWFFVAVKIQLDRESSFKQSSTPNQDDPEREREHQALQAAMSSGELHPLRISFDTPQCIFPLKVSAVGAKPAEVSLYVLASEPLLNKYMFQRGALIAHETAVQRSERHPYARAASMRNLRRMRLSWMMYSLMPPAPDGKRAQHD